MNMNTGKAKRKVLLKGEGIHQHTLVGDFNVVQNPGGDQILLDVRRESCLVHEKPDRSEGEHLTLPVEPGRWIMGRQVEFDPFSNENGFPVD